MVALPVALVYKNVHASTSGNNESVANQRFILTAWPVRPKKMSKLSNDIR